MFMLVDDPGPGVGDGPGVGGVTPAQIGTSAAQSPPPDKSIAESYSRQQ